MGLSAGVLLALLGLIGCAAEPTPTPGAHPTGERLPTSIPREDLPAYPLDSASGYRGNITGDAPLELVYPAGGTVTIRAVPLDDSEPLDLTLMVLDNQLRRLAYEDDGDSGELVLERFMLGDAPPYTLRFDSFNGFQSGEIEVIVTQVDPFALTTEAEGDTSRLSGELPAGMVFTWPLSLAAGASLTASVSTEGDAREMWLRLLTVDGEALAGPLPELDYTAAEASDVVLEVREIAGRGGPFRVIIRTPAP